MTSAVSIVAVTVKVPPNRHSGRTSAYGSKRPVQRVVLRMAEAAKFDTFLTVASANEGKTDPSRVDTERS